MKKINKKENIRPVLSVKDAIFNYKAIRDEFALGELIISLKFRKVYIANDSEIENNVSEADEFSKIECSKELFPAIILTNDYKFWFTCFSDKDEIPADYLEKYTIEEVMFLDLIDICLKNREIEGISINCSSESHVTIPKLILRGVRDFMKN